MTPEGSKKRSSAWYLLPIFFHLIGGVIAFFAIRNDDPQKAKRCLILGGILLAVNIIIAIALMDSFSNPENMFTDMTTKSQIELQFNEASIEVELNESGKFLAFRWDPIIIPIENIEKIHDQLPKQTISDIRNPGTFVPDTVKAGTYYTLDGDKEFWFTKDGKNSVITIELKNHEFKRIVLESEKSQLWIENLNKVIIQK